MKSMIIGWVLVQLVIAGIVTEDLAAKGVRGGCAQYAEVSNSPLWLLSGAALPILMIVIEPQMYAHCQAEMPREERK